MSDEKLATHLKKSRIRSGMTQSEVAKKLFVTRQAIGRWEHGEATPTPQMLIKLASTYHESVDYLLGVEGLEKDTQKNDSMISAKTINEMSKKHSYLLLILALVSGFIPIIGMIAPLIVIWLNRTNKYLHRLVFYTALIVWVLSTLNSLNYIYQIFQVIGWM